MLTLPSKKMVNGWIFFIVTGLMLFALYLQLSIGLHPCPLCITQRLFMVAVGLVALVAVIHNPQHWGGKVYAILGALLCVLGGIVAGRHVWLQHLPDEQVPSCGPGLDYIFANFPFQQAIELLFKGDGNCADVVWTLMGLSIPAWVLVSFCALFVLNALQVFRR